jgi:hypothetical protein
LKHKVSGEPSPVSSYLLIQPLCPYAIELCQVRIEQHPLTAHDEYSLCYFRAGAKQPRVSRNQLVPNQLDAICDQFPSPPPTPHQTSVPTADSRAELSAQLVVARLGVFDRVVQERRGFVSLPTAA